MLNYQRVSQVIPRFCRRKSWYPAGFAWWQYHDVPWCHGLGPWRPWAVLRRSDSWNVMQTVGCSFLLGMCKHMMTWLILGVPSGKLLHNYRKSPFSMGNPTISMVIFNSYVSHNQRVWCPPNLGAMDSWMFDTQMPGMHQRLAFSSWAQIVVSHDLEVKDVMPPADEQQGHLVCINFPRILFRMFRRAASPTASGSCIPACWQRVATCGE